VLPFAGDQLVLLWSLRSEGVLSFDPALPKADTHFESLSQHVAHSERSCILQLRASMRFSTCATHRAAYSCCPLWEQQPTMLLILTPPTMVLKNPQDRGFLDLTIQFVNTLTIFGLLSTTSAFELRAGYAPCF